MKHQAIQGKQFEKFEHPHVTADGAERATVALTAPKTLWFNTGTLCNITCVNCYIESSPKNDALVYLSEADVRSYLAQIRERNWPITEIGFTGGEPFMNPEMIAMARAALEDGYEVLILTNAMQPMMRNRVRDGLLGLLQEFGRRLTLRVSLDHWSAELHDAERGEGAHARTLEGMQWLARNGFRMTVAGRSAWCGSDREARESYARFYARHGFEIEAHDPVQTVLFPEMEQERDVPEITTACWGILGKNPADVMCASSRMVVKRRGAASPVVLACTLLPYDRQFELGATLEDAEKPVALNHRYCAEFCVLGGASCSA